eukprot:gene21888-biopygen23663
MRTRTRTRASGTGRRGGSRAAFGTGKNACLCCLLGCHSVTRCQPRGAVDSGKSVEPGHPCIGIARPAA